MGRAFSAPVFVNVMNFGQISCIHKALHEQYLKVFLSLTIIVFEIFRDNLKFTCSG